MTAEGTSSRQQVGSRRGRLHRSAPRWLLFIPVAIATVIVLLGGPIVTFNHHISVLPEDQGLAEQVLGVLAGTPGRVATLTGRMGPSVLFVYDPVRHRGPPRAVRLHGGGHDRV